MRIVAGSLLGFALLTLLAMSGVAAILVNYPSVLFVLKCLGALYLFYLADMLVFKAKREPLELPATHKPTGLFRAGLYLAILNPKIILFWIAFIPTLIT
ncbi:MAG TPA: hypothetical protein DCF92_05460 [Idiomarina sp.]|nr:hypothetical protein [Idiomarina sp.]